MFIFGLLVHLDPILTLWRQDGSFHSWINVWAAGKTMWSLVNTCHSECFRGDFWQKGAIQMSCLQLLFGLRLKVKIISQFRG